MPTITARPIERLTLAQLAKLTPPIISRRASAQCNVLRRQYEVGSRDGFRRTYTRDKIFYNEMRVYSRCLDGRRNSYIRFFGPPDKDSPVWVWCSCPYFTYNLAVALARRNCSSVKLSNGRLPRVRNRKMVPHLCKHLVMTAGIALREKKDLAAEKLQELKEKEAGAKGKLPLNRGDNLKIEKRRFVQPLDEIP